MKTLIPSSEEWASKQLDLKNSSENDSSLLKYLEDENFLLNDLESEALDILSGREGDFSAENYKSFCAEQLLKEITSFRKDFFSIPIQERRETLKSLEKAAEYSMSCKAMLYELRLAVFIDVSLIPEHNKAIKYVEGIFTSPPQKRSIFFDEIERKTEEEKKELYKDYQELENFDSDLLRLCPHLENILNPKVVEEITQKPKKRGKTGIYLLVLIIIYLLYKIISLGIEREAEEKTTSPEIKTGQKEDAGKSDKKEVDKFLEYMENKEGKPEKNPEKSNE